MNQPTNQSLGQQTTFFDVGLERTAADLDVQHQHRYVLGRLLGDDGRCSTPIAR